MTLIVVLGVSNPGGYIWMTLWVCAMGGPLGALGLILWYGVHCGAYGLARSRGLHLRRTKRAWLGWITTPLAVLIMLSAILTDWPLRARFALSRPSFQSAAQAAVSGTSSRRIRFVGLYFVERTRVENGDVYFETGADMLDPAGFMYSPTRCTPSNPNFISQNWCTYSD
ncbi:MAG TPA: hypothetical protein P5572_14200 [Phycisphaerae bacterium]|nr:hypothetical protein [Phycisphaerales bacterium]HRX86169.1 hypothetical protein [Phycisphaerae bacterium]